MSRDVKRTEAGYIAQLKDLLAECRSMAAYGERVWGLDVKALEWAIGRLEEEKKA